MTDDSLVSVLIPAYNHEQYVAECLASVVDQTHPDLELVIANDGSTDGTHDVIEAFLARHADRFTRVVYLNRPNRGVSATMNELLAQASGRLLYQIASDDRAKPHAIETLRGTFSRHPRHALAVGDNEIIDDTGTRVFWDAERNNVNDPAVAIYRTFADFLRSGRPARDFSPRGFGHVGALVHANYIPNGKLFRRAAVVAVGGWRTGTVEDWDLNFRLARRYRFTYVDEILFSYRWHATNSIKDAPKIDKLAMHTYDLIDAERSEPWLRLRVRLHNDPARWLVSRMRAVASQYRHGGPPADLG